MKHPAFRLADPASAPARRPIHSIRPPVSARERAAARVALRRQCRLLGVLAAVVAGGFVGWLGWAVPAVKRLLNGG